MGKIDRKKIILVVLGIFLALALVISQLHKFKPSRIAQDGRSFNFTAEKFLDYYNKATSQNITTLESEETDDEIIYYFTSSEYDIRITTERISQLVTEINVSYTYASNNSENEVVSIDGSYLEKFGEEVKEIFEICAPNENIYDFEQFIKETLYSESESKQIGKIYINWSKSLLTFKYRISLEK